ncbi:four helix bundle protein [Myxococcota bacterium]
MLKIYPVAAMLPVEERVALASQLRRAAVSVPTNSAEGSKRRSPQDSVWQRPNRRHIRPLFRSEGSCPRLSRASRWLDSAGRTRTVLFGNGLPENPARAETLDEPATDPATSQFPCSELPSGCPQSRPPAAIAALEEKRIPASAKRASRLD